MHDAPKTQPPPSRRLRSIGRAGAAMSAYYQSLHSAGRNGEAPIAWVSSVGPAELLTSMGFRVYFPENHAAMLGAKRQGEAHMMRAEARGYSPDICAYLRSDIGAFLAHKCALTDLDKRIDAPPGPNVLVYNTNQCRDIKEWFTWYADKLKVPCIGIESPTNIETITKEHIGSVTSQIRALVPQLEHIGNVKFDIDRLRETLGTAREVSELWRRVLETGSRRPSPLSFKDTLSLMGPAVVMRTDEATATLYRDALSELELRVDKGIGAQKTERFRLYWDGMPVWGRISELDRLFKGLGAATVASTYCGSWVFDAFDPADPFDSMAEAYTALFIVRSDRAKREYLQTAVRQFGIDGIIYHEAKTCPANSNTRYGLPDRLHETLNVPHTVLYGDHIDTRLYDSERVATQLEALAEQMAARQRG